MAYLHKTSNGVTLKTRRYPWPIYSAEQKTPTCEEGADCDAAENPDHHVTLDLTKQARLTVEALIESLEEVHVENIELEDSGSMTRHRREEPGCSYCLAIHEARLLLAAAREAR